MSVDPNVPKPPLAGLARHEHDALPPGTRFGEFEILRALGVGGFGIVYLAQDHSLERLVALKEYMPAALAARGEGAMVAIRSSSFAHTYAIGLRSFINEARLLARFDHPSLVKVYRFWEDNGTAYMVMPYLQGRTLRDARRAMGGPPEEFWLRGVLSPMLDALDLLHREGVFHRDIAPDNVLLAPDGVPVLLDFGAARRVISDRTQSLTAILKPSYAPIEQYAEMAAMRQGPWTDIYAMGAVLHFLLFGVPPAPATARAVQEDAEQIEHRAVAGVSPGFLAVVGWMLRVRPQERPQSVAAVRAALDGTLTVPPDVRHEVTRPMVQPVPPAPFGRTGVDPAFAATALDQRHTAGPTAGHVAVSGSDRRTGPGVSALGRTAPNGEAATTVLARDGDGGTVDADKTVTAMPPSRAHSGTGTPAAGVPPRMPSEGGPARLPSGGAPMRSTPPGTAPPAYVPPPRSPPILPASDAIPASWAAPPDARRPAAGFWVGRRRAVIGSVSAALLAAVVLWQFVEAIGRQRAPDLTAVSAPASAPRRAAAALPASQPARPPTTEPTAAAATASIPDPASAPALAGLGRTGQPDGIELSRTATASSPVSDIAPVAASASDQKRRPTTRTALNSHRERARMAGPANPRQACGSRTFISLALCMDRECDRPRFRALPECERVLDAQRRRSGNY